MDASAAGFGPIVPQTAATPWQCPLSRHGNAGAGATALRCVHHAGPACGWRRLQRRLILSFLSGVRPVQKTAKPTTPTLPRSIALIGAPTDIGAGARRLHGTGSPARRRPGSGHRGPGLRDRGPRQSVWPGQPWQPPVDGYRHLAEVAAWNRAVHDAVHAELRQASCPSCWAATTAWASARSAPWRAIAATPARNCGCCGWTRMPISTPTRSRPPAISMACPWPACAATARRRSPACPAIIPTSRPPGCARSAYAAWTREKRLVHGRAGSVRHALPG